MMPRRWLGEDGWVPGCHDLVFKKGILAPVESAVWVVCVGAAMTAVKRLAHLPIIVLPFKTNIACQ